MNDFGLSWVSPGLRGLVYVFYSLSMSLSIPFGPTVWSDTYLYICFHLSDLTVKDNNRCRPWKSRVPWSIGIRRPSAIHLCLPSAPWSSVTRSDLCFCSLNVLRHKSWVPPSMETDSLSSSLWWLLSLNPPNVMPFPNQVLLDKLYIRPEFLSRVNSAVLRSDNHRWIP